MAGHQRFLDRLTGEVRAHIRQIGGDPDFVAFVLGWYGLLRVEPVVARALRGRTWVYWSTSRQRQVKRALQRRHGAQWKPVWIEIQARARLYCPPRVTASLFALEPQGAPPSHGAFRWNWWLAVGTLKLYFTRVATRPHWDVLAAVFYPEHTFSYAQAEWGRRKNRVAGLDVERRLNQMIGVYATYAPVILEVLNTGIPLWVSPHREHFERLAAAGGTAACVQIMTGYASETRAGSPSRVVVAEAGSPPCGAGEGLSARCADDVSVSLRAARRATNERRP